MLSETPTPISKRPSFRVSTSTNKTKRSRGFTSIYLGIVVVEDTRGNLYIGYSLRDSFNSSCLPPKKLERKRWTTTDGSGPQDRSSVLANEIIRKLEKLQGESSYKFVAAGLNKNLAELSPVLCSRLWLGLDIVPLVFDIPRASSTQSPPSRRPSLLRSTSRFQEDSLNPTVDKEAKTLAQNCASYFGDLHLARVTLGSQNEVAVDCDGHARISSKEDFQRTVGKATWDATIKYATSLRERKIKIAFFNSTPQGGGVALMIHALIRFLRLLEVDARWYCPVARADIFRITKDNHNVLQGVAGSSRRLTAEEIRKLNEWSESNAELFWIAENGPLAPISFGGAHVVIVDDPQMPSLVKIAKEQDPSRPVIYRSHIQVRADLANEGGTPTSKVWDRVYENIKDADVFVSHPIRQFIPNNVIPEKVAYVPATSDWLDGLSKSLNAFSDRYYLKEFATLCFEAGMPQLKYPHRHYIAQIARFDPAKGIPDVLASYAELRRVYMKDEPLGNIPQLVLAGHGAVDDPDAKPIYEQTLQSLENEYADIKDDVIVIRVPPSDQILNSILSNARVVLQLSTREGFEVKVSEAVHKGLPIIATKAGGIPLQVQHGKSGYLVEPGDFNAVAKHLSDLFTDDRLYTNMSSYAKTHVSDEVSTVGNALCWLYLADRLSEGHTVHANCRWVNDMAREEARLPYTEDETRLPRDIST